MLRTLTLVALALPFFGSCSSTNGLYRWGSYEDSVWAVTHAEGNVDVGAEIDSLVETVERSRAEGRRVPPGMHAHLGLLYSMRGELDTAQAAFESERELYPESAVFIDGLIARMRGSQ